MNSLNSPSLVDTLREIALTPYQPVTKQMLDEAYAGIPEPKLTDEDIETLSREKDGAFITGFSEQGIFLNRKGRVEATAPATARKTP